jgi:hypothetical protein
LRCREHVSGGRVQKKGRLAFQRSGPEPEPWNLELWNP